jgi:hypothetical protein
MRMYHDSTGETQNESRPSLLTGGCLLRNRSGFGLLDGSVIVRLQRVTGHERLASGFGRAGTARDSRVLREPGHR